MRRHWRSLAIAVLGGVIGFGVSRLGLARRAPEPTGDELRCAPAGVVTDDMFASTAEGAHGATPPSARGDMPRMAPAPAAPTAVAERSGGVVAPEDPGGWDSVPLDQAAGESLGSLETRKAVLAGISAFSRPAFPRCFADYAPPRDMERYQLEVDLRVVATEKDYLIEDAVPISATYGDDRLERCILAIYRGQRIPVTPETPGKHRLRWPTVKYFRPSGQP